MTRDRELRRIFRSIVFGLSAPAVASAWLACGPGGDTNDAGPDATIPDAEAGSDASDGGSIFGESSIDSYVDWCEAGPPQFITLSGCNDILYVPCGAPEGDYLATDSGALGFNRCDQICAGWEQFHCEVLTYGQMQLLFEALDAGDDAADFDAADGGGVDANDIPPINGPFYIACDCTGGGRKPMGLRRRRNHARTAVGEYLAEMAHLEAASVVAFARMQAELAALGAPRSLLQRLARAARDEEQHTSIVGALARRFGARPEAPRVRRFRARSVESIARENAVEGCVNETYGALVATWQAARAEDPSIRSAMQRIAVDETRHAAIAASAAAFLSTKLDARARQRIARARKRAIERLRAGASSPPNDLTRIAGIPGPADANRLLDALAQSVWASDAMA